VLACCWYDFYMSQSFPCAASSSSASAVEVMNLHKHFHQSGKASGQTINALQGLSFKVPKGITYSILGPNGAGKTTLLRILTTITRPSQGQAILQGIDILKHPFQARQHLGVVFQNNHFNKYLNLWQNLELHAQLHGIEPSVYKPEIQRLLEAVGLYDRRLSMGDQLSGGQQRRIALIRALIHKPSVLFLDEPTTGLDPQARQDLWLLIEDLKQADTTVILTTHYMEEAERLSDEVLMMHHGKTVLEGTPDAIKRSMGQQHLYQFELVGPDAAQYQARFASTPDALEQTIINPYQLEVVCPNRESFHRLLALVDCEDLAGAGQVKPSLESVFLTVANHMKADETVPMTALNSLAPSVISTPASEEPTHSVAVNSSWWPQLHWRAGILPMIRKVLKTEACGYELELVTTIIYPFTFFLAFGLGLRPFMSQVDGMPYPTFLVPGLIAYVILLSSFSVGAWNMWLDRWHQGMLDEARIKPIGMSDIILGQMLGSFATALIKGLIVAGFLWFLTGVHFPVINLLPFMVIVLPGSLLFTGFGTLVGTLFRKPDNIAQSMTIIVTPLLYLGGLFFPTSSLPNWLEPWVRWLPTTALFSGGRQALLQGFALVDWMYVALLWAYALLMIVFTVRTFNRRLTE
jgi:ABC-2 type transport system ATP-binding protein